MNDDHPYFMRWYIEYKAIEVKYDENEGKNGRMSEGKLSKSKPNRNKTS